MHVLILYISQVTQDEGVKEALQGVQQGARKAPFSRVLDPRCHPAQFLVPAFRSHFMSLKVRARQSGGRVGGRSCFGQGASGSFHFTFFFLRSGEAQKEKKEKHTKRGKHQKTKLTLYDDSRAIIRPIFSLVHLTRDQGQKQKVTGVGVWCGRGENENSPYPRTLAPKPPETRRSKNTPVGSLLPRGFAKHNRRGVGGNSHSHTRRYARTDTRIFTHAKR